MCYQLFQIRVKMERVLKYNLEGMENRNGNIEKKIEMA